MRVAIYARVSTSDQSTAMQDELREYAKHRGFEIVGEFQDVMSGATESRPGLSRLMAAAKRRRFDGILVYRFDRFARSLSHLARALAEFDALGIAFISLHEAVDTTTPTGRLTFGIFASIAEFERAIIRERTISGQAAARRRGARFGRPRVAPTWRQVADLRADGLSYNVIAAKLGIAKGTAVALGKTASAST